MRYLIMFEDKNGDTNYPMDRADSLSRAIDIAAEATGHREGLWVVSDMHKAWIFRLEDDDDEDSIEYDPIDIWVRGVGRPTTKNKLVRAVKAR